MGSITLAAATLTINNLAFTVYLSTSKVLYVILTLLEPSFKVV